MNFNWINIVLVGMAFLLLFCGGFALGILVNDTHMVLSLKTVFLVCISSGTGYGLGLLGAGGLDDLEGEAEK